LLGYGTVIIDGGFVQPDGRVVRRGRFTFAPAAGGVRLSFSGQRGDAFELSSFHRSPPSVRQDSGSLTVEAGGEGLRIAAPNGALGTRKVDLSSGLASGMDVGLTRARARISLESPGDVAVTYGAGGG
jgi:hypothetical protein